MAIKNLLLAYDGGRSADAALHMAGLMAAKYDAHLTGLLAYNTGEVHRDLDRWISDDTRAVLQRAQEDALAEVEKRFRAHAAEENLSGVEFLRVAGRADLVVADCARFYDITVIGRFNPYVEDARLILHPDRVALKSGRPILVIPPEFSGKALHEHALVAWDGSRAAARALSDAMQILETKTLVTLVTVGDGARPQAGRNIEEHLQRHGVTTEWVRLEETGPVGKVLVEYTGERDPDVLIMGAYEHSKFREDFFGGATDAILRQTKVPVLISH